jgi:hypothetical protein
MNAYTYNEIEGLVGKNHPYTKAVLRHIECISCEETLSINKNVPAWSHDIVTAVVKHDGLFCKHCGLPIKGFHVNGLCGVCQKPHRRCCRN